MVKGCLVQLPPYKPPLQLSITQSVTTNGERKKVSLFPFCSSIWWWGSALPFWNLHGKPPAEVVLLLSVCQRNSVEQNISQCKCQFVPLRGLTLTSSFCLGHFPVPFLFPVSGSARRGLFWPVFYICRGHFSLFTLFRTCYDTMKISVRQGLGRCLSASWLHAL